MAKKVSKIKKQIVIQEVPDVAATNPSFDIAFANMLLTKTKGGLADILTLEEYTAIRKEMLSFHLGVKSLDSANSGSMNYAVDAARLEYGKGFEGVEVGLRWLWDRYVAGKIKDQMVAEFVFKILIKGIEDGIQALLNAIRKKKPDVADTVEDVITTVGTVINDGSLDEFTADVNATIEEIKQANKPSETGEKKSLITRIWNGIKKAIFKIIH